MPKMDLNLPINVDDAPFCTPGPEGHCAVCADEGLPARVLALQPGDLALVEMAGRQQEVGVDLVDGVAVGDWLLVHAGFAIARLEASPDE